MLDTIFGPFHVFISHYAYEKILTLFRMVMMIMRENISSNTVFITIYEGITPYKAQKSLEVSACLFMVSRFQSYFLETLLFSITLSTNP